MLRSAVGRLFLFLFATLVLPACAGGTDPLIVVPVDPLPTDPPPPAPTPTPTPPPPGPTPPPVDELAGGVLATFRVDGIDVNQQPFTEWFSVWVTNPQTINDLFDIQAGIGANRHVNGKILEGSGQGDHNAPWSWHFDPDDVHMADVSMEVCDGRPSYVEDNLAAYLAIERYCPWAGVLDSLEDHR